VVADAKLVRSHRRAGVEKLCRVDRDLSRVGIGRPSGDGVRTEALGKH
jgi:hypothetical protein